MAESSGGAASKGRAAPLNAKKGGKRAAAKAIAGTKAGIPFKSGFRTARGQKAFTARGGKNNFKPGTSGRAAGAKSKKQTKKAAASKRKAGKK